MEIGKRKNHVSSWLRQVIYRKIMVLFILFFFLTEYTFSYHFTLKLDAIVHMEGVDCLLAGYLLLHIITITFFF
jgi:hypothetical protein